MKENYVDIDIDSLGKPSAKVWIESEVMDIQTVTKIGEYDYVIRISPSYPEDTMDITLIRKPEKEEVI